MLALAGAVLAVIPGPATATIVNLTDTAIDGNPVSTNLGVRGGFIGDAFYKFAIDGFDPEKAGSGDFRRLYDVKDNSTSNNAENGYNRNRVFDASVPGGFDPFISVSNLPTSKDGDYYVFALDINQNDAYLSLDNVQIYTRNGEDPSPLPTNYSQLGNLGTLRYAMNDSATQSYVIMDYKLAPGSGQQDLFLLVKKSLFEGAGAGDHVYLYSAFGQYSLFGSGRTDTTPNDGFEEWALPISPDVQVPEPSGIVTLLLVSGCLFCCARHRRETQKSRG